MYQKILTDPSFFSLLFKYDQDLAEQARKPGCPCRGVLHRADYPRKPRGGPEDLDAEFNKRISFCCAEEGCRKRMTPPSLRFLGRRVYLMVVVVLVSAMCQGITAKRMKLLSEQIGACRRTLDRWQGWWREAFSESPFWKKSRGRFSPPILTDRLPGSLLERFNGADTSMGILKVLAFLSPLSTATCPGKNQDSLREFSIRRGCVLQ
ncbi:MAG: hypothetical protein KJ831_00300 [Candidatus Eisenbacteria bacterium]|nr:hypothetical protein [Planctomycetota bacterium]MBU1698561.1 hypothetical protein [Candidatus Eisenbacteria bacterium]